jgi:LacI family transcriptional regulator
VETPGSRAVRRSVTLRDVAAAARVHVATASRPQDAETAHPVSPETRERVRQVAEELGYRHHMMARGLRRGFSSTVGVVVADLGHRRVVQPPGPLDVQSFQDRHDAFAEAGLAAIRGRPCRSPARRSPPSW